SELFAFADLQGERVVDEERRAGDPAPGDPALERGALGIFGECDDRDRGEASEIRLESPEELRGADGASALDAREQLERLIERAEAATQRELVHRVADDEDVDERLASRQMC